jgi:hypothetical protein
MAAGPRGGSLNRIEPGLPTAVTGLLGQGVLLPFPYVGDTPRGRGTSLGFCMLNAKAVPRHDGSRVHLAEHPGRGLPC